MSVVKNRGLLNRRWKHRLKVEEALSGVKKTPQEIRILWLKKRHEMVKLRRKYPEVDWSKLEREED